MEAVTAGATIIGIINAVKVQFPEIKGIYAIGLAVALGAVMGWFQFLVGDLESGIIAGLVSSGIYTVAKRMGGK